MNRYAKAFMLLEVLLALTIAMVSLLAVGHAFQSISSAQRRTEARWMSIMACRTTLETACHSLCDIDTVFIVGLNTISAQARIDSLPRGELLVRATAFFERDGHERYTESTLSRLLWPGQGT